MNDFRLKKSFLEGYLRLCFRFFGLFLKLCMVFSLFYLFERVVEIFDEVFVNFLLEFEDFIDGWLFRSCLMLFLILVFIFFLIYIFFEYEVIVWLLLFVLFIFNFLYLWLLVFFFFCEDFFMRFLIFWDFNFIKFLVIVWVVVVEIVLFWIEDGGWEFIEIRNSCIILSISSK